MSEVPPVRTIAVAASDGQATGEDRGAKKPNTQEVVSKELDLTGWYPSIER
jgi:hypothetical protein